MEGEGEREGGREGRKGGREGGRSPNYWSAENIYFKEHRTTYTHTLAHIKRITIEHKNTYICTHAHTHTHTHTHTPLNLLTLNIPAKIDFSWGRLKMHF